MEMRFTPEHKSINDLFARDIKYIIPEYQRPYSWDCIGKSDKNNQVNVMWEDLLEYYDKQEKKNTYFFGSMVLIGNGNLEYQVVDGQQRLTTTVLLFAAIKCFLNELRSSIKAENIAAFFDDIIQFSDEILYNKRRHGASTIEKKIRIEKSAGFDYDTVLGEALDCKTQVSADLIRFATAEQKTVCARYFNNVKYFKEKLSERFLNNGLFDDRAAEQLDNFIEFLKNRVSVVRILTPTFDVAYHIFEILNNRGLPLSNKDLFRNLLIKEWDLLKNSDPAKYKHIEPAALWSSLDNDFTFEDDFISRWVESYKASKQQYSAFNDIKEIYEKNYQDKFPRKKIELFYEDIKRDIGYYTNVVNNEFESPLVQSKFNFILNAPNYRPSVNFLLALVKCFDGNESAEMLTVLQAFERYIIYCLLCVRYDVSPIYSAIRWLNQKQWGGATQALENAVDREDLVAELSSRNLFDNEMAKLLLAKIVWHEQVQTNNDTVEQLFLYENASLEHIIPQYTEGTDWESKFSKPFINEYTYALGNMTLLTTKLNSAAKNSSFAVKRKFYAKTKLPMTLRLAGAEELTEEFIRQRHQNFVKTILADIGLAPEEAAL